MQKIWRSFMLHIAAALALTFIDSNARIEIEYRIIFARPLMLITRWQAHSTPTKEQVMMMLDLEGLEATIETHSSKEKISEHRHPFTEVRVILQGEILFNIAGNQFLVRPGDRLEIPANTKHWHQNHGEEEAVSIYSQRIF